MVHQYHALLWIALWQIASLRESDSVAMLKHELVACVWFYASAGWSLLLIVTESVLTKAHVDSRLHQAQGQAPGQSIETGP